MVAAKDCAPGNGVSKVQGSRISVVNMRSDDGSKLRIEDGRKAFAASVSLEAADRRQSEADGRPQRALSWIHCDGLVVGA